MARPGLLTHPKFRRFARLAGLPIPHALGLLECLWMPTYEAGNPMIGDHDDVEAAAQWSGEKGIVCKALLDCGMTNPDGTRGPGFIEPVPHNTNVFQVHDLFDHAPDYVRRRMERESARCKKGESISDIRRRAVSVRWAKNSEKPHENTNEYKRKSLGECPDTNGATPAPAPAPAPAPIDNTTDAAHPYSLGFAKFWKEYPPGSRKTEKPKCYELWKKKKLEPITEKILEIIGVFKASKSWTDEGGQFVPGPLPWLRKEPWKTDLQDLKANPIPQTYHQKRAEQEFPEPDLKLEFGQRKEKSK